MSSANCKPLYAKIEIARKQLPEMGDDEFFYGTFLTERYGSAKKTITSKKQLSFAQLVDCVNELARLGAVFTSAKRGKAKSRTGEKPYLAKAAGRRSDFYEIPDGPQARQKRHICAMWRELGYDMTSLDTRVKRTWGVEAFRWLNNPQHLAALSSDLQRRLTRKRDKAAKAAQLQAASGGL